MELNKSEIFRMFMEMRIMKKKKKLGIDLKYF